MNIMYLHGFASHFDPNNDKVYALSLLGNVCGPNINYILSFEHNLNQITKYAIDNAIDLIVGCSMGGFLASHVSERSGIPFVALNPVYDPKDNLSKAVGYGKDYQGVSYYLDQATVDSYPSFNMNGDGLIMFQTGDTIINLAETVIKLKDRYVIDITAGGSHRYDNLDRKINTIKSFINISETRQ